MVCCARCNAESKNNTLCEECERILQNRINIVLEEEFPQTEGYDSKYFVELSKYSECPLCLGALRDPVQIAGECGHVFCGSCLNRATPGEPKTCPLDREPFIQTFPDRSKRKEVLSLKVTCQNNGCLWKGELSDLLDHVRENCGRLLLSCLNSDCPEKLCREMILEHCLECNFATGIPCTFVQFGCQFEGRRSQIDNHTKTYVNEHLSLTTTKIYQQENKIKQQENKLNQQDSKIKEQEKKINQQEKKINKQENKTKQQENKINKQDKKINQQENKIKQQDNKMKELNKKVDQILELNKTNDVKLNEFKIKNNNLQEENNDLKIQNDEIIKKNEDLKKDHSELKLKQDELQEKFYYVQSVLLNKDNIFVWNISNYQTNFRNAQNKTPVFIYSPAFYTKDGYKFQLTAYLDGDGRGNSTHTGLYFCLCKGVNDDTLVWPFNKKITLTIVSQNYLRVVDKTQTFVPAEQGEDTMECFMKPTLDRNAARGWSQLLPHIEKENYIKDDTVIIKCAVEC